MQSHIQYTDIYRTNRQEIHDHSAAPLNALRDEAHDRLLELGLPTRKLERYKYTDIEALLAPDYGLNIKRLPFQVNPYEAFRCDVPNLSTSLYFILNDAFYNQAQGTAPLPPGVKICSLCQAAAQWPELVTPYYGQLARSSKDGINALNTMLAQDGLFVYLPEHTVIERPIQIVNLLRSTVPLMLNRRVLVVAEEGAQASLLFCDHAIDNIDFLTTQVIEVYAKPQAAIDIYELEETHVHNKRISNLYINAEASSHVNHYNMTLHNGITRNRTDVSLVGPDAYVGLYGCVVADKEQHVDNNTLIDHRAPSCQSDQLYKYVLNDRSVGAFAGRILVREGAQKTVSNERNANLCATNEARMYTQPMLEIYADDVKCAHGSTVGQLNNEALFYMQQRGIALPEARLLLQMAFATEVVEHMRLEPIRTRLLSLVEKRFRGELSNCKGCTLCK